MPVIGPPEIVIQSSAVVPVHAQSLREAVTALDEVPPPALNPALVWSGVRVPDPDPFGRISKVKPAVTPTPVTTVRTAVPGLTSRLAGTRAVTWLGLTNVVARGVPFQFTTASAPKPVPYTVKVKPALNAAAVVGLLEMIVRGVGPAGITVSRYA